MNKNYFSCLRVKKRKNELPELNQVEESTVKLFLLVLRKSNNQLFINHQEKKLIIKYKNTTIIMDRGLLTINLPNQNNTLLLPVNIESYLWREFIKTYERKIFILESKVKKNIQQNTNKICDYSDYQF